MRLLVTGATGKVGQAPTMRRADGTPVRGTATAMEGARAEAELRRRLSLDLETPIVSARDFVRPPTEPRRVWQPG